MPFRKVHAFRVLTWVLFGVGPWAGLFFLPPAEALHETDHRFSVEGHICGNDGKPLADVEVIIKDPRIGEGKAASTDSDGYYKATLHLHNENYLDPIHVSALDEKKEVRAEFDPKDKSTERIVTVNLGAPCQSSGEGIPHWVYYGAGAGLVAVVVGLVRIGVNRKRRRQDRAPKKGGRKSHKR